jgi:hypothetical protein
VEKFDQTRGFKKNMEILALLKKKLAQVVGVGNVDEIITLTFNELGTSAKYITDEQWMQFTEKVINEHIRKLGGDMVADKEAWRRHGGGQVPENLDTRDKGED